MQLVRFQYNDLTQWGQIQDSMVWVTQGMNGAPIGTQYPLSEIKLLPPAKPSKIICVGRNYLDHIKELSPERDSSNTDHLPNEPGLFLKTPNTLAEHGGTVVRPDWSNNFHFEGELALVIGQHAKNLTQEQALDAVLGYTCALDLTARDKQKSDLQWFRAKSTDRFCPLGPWLETDLDPSALRIQTRVNGQIKQDSSTSHMIFNIPHILEYLTTYITLEPGDVVLTGTPEGVGPLNSGDLVEVEIEGIGILETQIG